MVNLTRYAMRGSDCVHTIIGGFLLPDLCCLPMVPHVIAELPAINPAVLIPAQCVGVREAFALAGRFPDALTPNAVGTSDVFGQSASEGVDPCVDFVPSRPSVR
jgi:7,8-dihydropterin-6-yl-methyl-4-(beta-D-ribofuranosyl)aminobenzene 5'-phosphate synthase